MKVNKTNRSNGKRKPSAAQVWAEVEDRFVPTFAPWPSERVVYLWLLRQSRLAGRETIRVSFRRFAAVLRMSVSALKQAFRRLTARGAIQVREKDYLGHLIRVLLPSEIRSIPRSECLRMELDVEALNFHSRSTAREMIYARERHRCFYCGRKLKYSSRGLDHVVPRSRGGDDSYRNVVACCAECNSMKGQGSAAKFVKLLQSFGVLSRKELRKRLMALQAVRHGKLKPKFSASRRLRMAA